jgi:hypothetical protein
MFALARRCARPWAPVVLVLVLSSIPGASQRPHSPGGAGSATRAPAAAADDLAAPVATATDLGPVMSTPLVPVLERDCGFTTRLSDGLMLWVYCDTFYRTNTGVDHLTQSSTSAFAASPAPTTMREYVADLYGEHIPNTDTATWDVKSFIPVPPDPIDFPCDGGFRKNWPRSATNVHDPVAGLDRVIVYYMRVCDKSVDVIDFSEHGIGVAEYDHVPGSVDPVAGPTGPVQARILEDNLFPLTSDVGGGAFLSFDGLWLHSYGCTWETCTAVRVRPWRVADRSAYRFWNGRWWGRTGAPMTVPGTRLPNAEITVHWEPRLWRYVMTYTPVLEFDTVVFRTARRPQGPWSAAMAMTLPDCQNDWALHWCYAALAQPHMSSGDLLAISFVREHEYPGPFTFRMHFGVVPVNALRTPWYPRGDGGDMPENGTPPPGEDAGDG